VHAFFDTHGQSMLEELTREREQTSAAMEFERAAEIHQRHQKVKAASDLAAELVRPLTRLRAVIVQPAAKDFESDEPSAAVFMLQAGYITGPARLSTLGVRAVKEQTSVGSSLFAQPLMLQAIPLESQPNAVILSGDAAASASQSKDPETAGLTHTAETVLATSSLPPSPTLNPEARATAVIAELEQQSAAPADLATLSDHLSLLRRWYYRPEKHRAGEIFFPKEDSAWPVRRILNGAARAALGDPKPMAETQRDLAERNTADAAQTPARTKVLHAGRPEVERVVPAAPKPFRSRRTPSS
jgi:excinuclease ABC subunit C